MRWLLTRSAANAARFLGMFAPHHRSSMKLIALFILVLRALPSQSLQGSPAFSPLLPMAITRSCFATSLSTLILSTKKMKTELCEFLLLPAPFCNLPHPFLPPIQFYNFHHFHAQNSVCAR
jgi:hypothetical protein